MCRLIMSEIIIDYTVCHVSQMCRLIVSEIVTSHCITSRVEIIGKYYIKTYLKKKFSKCRQVRLIHEILSASEKWTAVADICRCLHNFNGVLQICAAFTNSSVFRLKDTWKRVSKTVYEYHELL